MSFPFAAVGSALGNLVGSGLSFFGGQAANNTTSINNSISQQLAQQQLNFEEAAAQNGIQWRVNDAKAAGISPLVALGAPTFSPGGPVFNAEPTQNSLAGAGEYMSRMGQDVSRAAMAAQTEQTRMQTVLGAEKMRADAAASSGEADKNAAMAGYYRALSEKITGANMGPSMPSVGGQPFVQGQGTPPGVVVQPSKDVHEYQTGIEGAGTPSVKLVRTPSGSYDPQPALGTSVGATGENLGWSIRNRLKPPPGYYLNWDMSWSKGESPSNIFYVPRHMFDWVDDNSASSRMGYADAAGRGFAP